MLFRCGYQRPYTASFDQIMTATVCQNICNNVDLLTPINYAVIFDTEYCFCPGTVTHSYNPNYCFAPCDGVPGETCGALGKAVVFRCGPGRGPAGSLLMVRPISHSLPLPVQSCVLASFAVNQGVCNKLIPCYTSPSPDLLYISAHAEVNPIRPCGPRSCRTGKEAEQASARWYESSWRSSACGLWRQIRVAMVDFLAIPVSSV
jgi:hypothetical protein